MRRNRFAWLAVIAVAVTMMAAVYLARAARRVRLTDHVATGVIVDDRRLRELLRQPHALFRSTRLGDGYGHIVATPPEGGVRIQSDLECDRVDAVVNAGICLTADRGVLTKYWAIAFDDALQPQQKVELSGIPSRVRLSPDGRLAGITVFVSGHAYSTAQFSTRTTLVSVGDGTVLADLEDFTVTRDDRPFKNANFNFWGVTFAADSNTFYATLGSGDQLYLIRADASTRTGEVVAEGIECPSLSPDYQRIAYKKRVYDGGRLVWRLAVLELSTMTTHVIDGELRSVDDQVEWLDDRQIVYAVADDTAGIGGTSIWKVDIEGGPASAWAEGAYSPSIVATVDTRTGGRL